MPPQTELPAHQPQPRCHRPLFPPRLPLLEIAALVTPAWPHLGHPWLGLAPSWNGKTGGPSMWGFCGCGWEALAGAGRQQGQFLRPSCQGRQSRLCERGPPCPRPPPHSQQIRPSTHQLARPAPPPTFLTTTNTQELGVREGRPAQAWRRGRGEAWGTRRPPPSLPEGQAGPAQPQWALILRVTHGLKSWGQQAPEEWESHRPPPALSLCLVNKCTGWMWLSFAYVHVDLDEVRGNHCSPEHCWGLDAPGGS